MVVADDHPVYRDGLVVALSAGGFDVVGEAADGRAVVALTLELQPDVVIMDLDMPVVGGVEASRRISHASPHVAILVLTMLADDDSVFAALRAGARGYLLKGAGPEEIVLAVRSVAAGSAIFGPAIAQRVMEHFGGGQSADPFPALTAREHEILAQIAAGRNNAAIAAQLALAPKTVRNHVSNILIKLQVSDRAQAMIRARNAGLG
ncbi:response regulator transcription factor [Microlunatus ginsengisoli]|uniref:Response regulator transcription factor n=1 Tax=Microlunatus ginsengisoli TaxID=363863 RepID=A0ABP7AKK1_9ACTN